MDDERYISAKQMAELLCVPRRIALQAICSKIVRAEKMKGKWQIKQKA